MTGLLNVNACRFKELNASHLFANILPIWVYSVAHVIVATGKMSVNGRISFQN